MTTKASNSISQGSPTPLQLVEHDSAPDGDHLTEAERFALELRWYEGRMLPYADWLTAFVERYHEEIRREAAGADEAAALLAATKRLIAQRGSIHMVGELKDQKREIENELWYRGEKGKCDRAGILLEWTARHAAAWRRWRIQEYLFVTDRCANQVVALLRTSVKDHAESSSG